MEDTGDISFLSNIRVRSCMSPSIMDRTGVISGKEVMDTILTPPGIGPSLSI